MDWGPDRLGLPPTAARADLAPSTVADAVEADAALLGLAQAEHPLALLRPYLAEMGAITSAEVGALPHGRRVTVAGRIEVLQRPGTAKGIAFISLADERGLVNLVLYPDVYAAARQVLRAAPVVVAHGAVQHEKGAVHVVVAAVEGFAGRGAG